MNPSPPWEDAFRKRIAAFRKAAESLGPEERRRLERRAVYAVAVGERLGLDDEALRQLRFEAINWDGAAPTVARILDVVNRFEHAGWPAAGPPLEPESAFEVVKQNGIREDEALILEALRQVAPLIQPIEA